MGRDALLRIFGVEAARHLARCRALLESRVAPGRPELDELFRALHSVKGMAVSLGLDEMSRLAHEAEDLVEAARRDVDPPSASFRDALAGRVSRLVELHRAATGAAAPASVEPLFSLLEADLSQVPVAPDRLDRLLEATLALASSHQRLEHALGPAEERPALFDRRAALERALQALRTEVLEMRLLSVGEVVPLLEPPLVRWAGQRGVRVALTVRGGAVRVDRAILERLLDPLGHLLRNAIVHGVEPPEERRVLGKPARATVELHVRRDGDRLAVTVGDDGRGIDPREVVRRARARGLLPPGSEPDGAAALDLLATPGMSSRETPDDLSGRGIGLAAVRETVARLGGTLGLEGAPGAGFRARLTVPTRLALVEAFLVEAAGQAFALPVDTVREVREGARADEAVGLAACLGLPPGGPAGGARRAALTLAGGSLAAPLSVDAVGGPRELVVQPLGPPLDRPDMPWAGAALLPEGGLALVLDPERLRAPTKL